MINDMITKEVSVVLELFFFFSSPETNHLVFFLKVQRKKKEEQKIHISHFKLNLVLNAFDWSYLMCEMNVVPHKNVVLTTGGIIVNLLYHSSNDTEVLFLINLPFV